MNRKQLFRSLIITVLLITQLILPLHAQSSVSDKIAVVRAQGATLLDDAGQTTGASVTAGSLLIVKGRNEDGSRLFVISENGASGWVAAGSLLIVNVASLPILSQSSTAATPLVETPIAEGQQPAQPAAASMSGQGQAISTTTALSTTTVQSAPNTAQTSVPTAATRTGNVSARVTGKIERLNLRSGPGMGFDIVGKAEVGSEWIAVGRDPQGDWVQMTAPGIGNLVWASASFLTLSVPIKELPVPDELPPTPVPPPATPTKAATPVVDTAAPNASAQEAAAPPTAATQPSSSSQTAKTGLSGTLVFQDRIGGTIYAYNLNSGSLRTLTGGIDPAISPDGKLVVFTRDGDGGGLFVINIDGSGERPLYKDGELLRSPKWSPDGGKIVFSRSNGFTDCRILKGKVCMPDDAIFELLPEELQGEMVTQKAVKDLPNSRQYFFTLSRVRLDNGEFRDIASKGAAGAPDWSYGGIVYQSNNGLQRTDDRSDSESVLIAQDIKVGNYIDPDQQPNGGRIVFQHSRGGHWQIYGVNPDGGGLAALTTLATVMVDALPSSVSPAWSPDGQMIVYLSNRNSYESAGPWHLWVMNADGSNQRRLPIEVEFDYSFGSEQMVSWGQ